MEPLLRIFQFLKSNPKMTLYFGPRLPNIYYGGFCFNTDDFGETYCDAKESMSMYMPDIRGFLVVTTDFVDDSHS